MSSQQDDVAGKADYVIALIDASPPRWVPCSEGAVPDVVDDASPPPTGRV